MELYKDCVVNNENEAYLLGLIYADGYITGKTKNTYYCLGFTFSYKDISFLEKINQTFFNRHVRIGEAKCKGKKYKTCRIFVGDVKLVDRLQKIGVFPNKTYNKDIRIFKNVPDEFKRDFIRGYFDGDGTVFAKKPSNQYGFGFVNKNREILDSIHNFLISQGLDGERNIRSDCGSYRLLIGGNKNCHFFKNLVYYKDKLICLERKRNVFYLIPNPILKTKHPYIGVRYYERNKKWVTVIYVDKNEKNRYIGIYNTPQEAALAYNIEAKKLNKKKLNEITKEKNEKYISVCKMEP